MSGSSVKEEAWEAIQGVPDNKKDLLIQGMFSVIALDSDFIGEALRDKDVGIVLMKTMLLMLARTAPEEGSDQ